MGDGGNGRGGIPRITVNPLLQCLILNRVNLLQHLFAMLKIVLRVEPHTWQRAEYRLHHVHLGGGKRSTFQHGTIAEQHTRIEVLNPVVLCPRNSRRAEIVGDRGNAEIRQVLLQPERMAFFFLALVVHPR